ncbi:hypothetical protein PHET_05344 [Paragonimus heterotremus]|uniref:Uncharacterized protein n=1 Tax=Paragonimus heterotremus TaxID=100268 RepID=A0A8J4T0J0_9TREM|nr:hypothetical protein PHET_05344 [Paragonimus heterotremus]
MKPGSSGVASRHHLHCVHRQPEADAGQRSGAHERKQSTSQTRRHLPTKTSTVANVTDQMRQVPEHARSQRRTPVVESPMNRYKRPSHQEPDDCRESEVPYPVSELFFSPHQAVSARDGRPVKSHGSSRHHQHHPACASLMGRTRPQLVEQESHKSSRAKGSSHSVPLPVSSLPVCVDKTRDTGKSKTHTTVETTDRVPATVQNEGKRAERTPEELNKDTKDTIEKLRQELRSAGFQVKDTTRSNELPRTPERRDPGAHRAFSASAQTTLTDANKRVHSRSTQRAAIARGDQVLTKDAPTTDLARTEPEKDKTAYTGTSATKETVMETSKMTTNLDMIFGVPPRNPVYLNSDTDSCEEHTGRDGDQVAVIGSERGHKRRETVPVPSEKDYTDPLGLPTTDSHLEQSTDTGKLVAPMGSIGVGPPQSAFSPRSHSPSLPLPFPLSDEQYDPTDVSLGSQASLLSSAASHKSESYCSECNRKGSYDSFSQTSSHSCCHSRQRRRGHRLDHCHYSRQPNFPSRPSSFCHACRSPHHHHHHHCYHRHLSDDRRYGRHHSHPHSHRSGRHHSERPHHNMYEKASSNTHKHGRSTSDKRRHHRRMSVSSSDQSEQSWTNSLTESSVSEAEEESKLSEISSGGDTLDVKAVLNRIRTQERKLRAELAKHRNLANQLRQAQQLISKSAAQDQSAETVVASEKDLSVPNVKSQKHSEKVLQSAKDKTPEGFECTPYSLIGEVRKKKSAPCKRQSGKSGKPFILENVKSAHKSSEKKEEKESAKSLHPVTRKLRHYRSHHHAPPVRKSIIPKTGSEMRTPVEIDDTVVTHDTAEDGDVNFDEGGLIIANTEALRGAEPDVDVTAQETKAKSDQPGLTSKIMLATFELEDIAEAAVSDEKVELGPSVMLTSTTEPQITCALTTLPAWMQYEVTSEVDRADQTEIISQAPTPPSSPPPSTFLVTSTPHDSPEKMPLAKSVQESQSIQELDEIEEQQSGHTTNVRWSSTNQLTELGLNEELSDGDSEYDGTRAINMLSEVIENALSLTSIQAASPDMHENSITDGSTQASSVCDDTHTSEASADTVKQVHSPRTVSPSCSSSSASEGSEEIEPFPPPPPESLIDVFATHETPLSHSHHLFSAALDEVIEEESRDIETENASNDILLKAESEDSQHATEALQTKSIIGNHDEESMSGSAVVEQFALIEELDISRRSELEPISEGGSVSSEVEQDGESLNLVLSVDLSDVHRTQQTDDEESTEVTTEVVQLSDDGLFPSVEESHEEEPAQVQLTETNGETHLDGAVDADIPSVDWLQRQDQLDNNVNAIHSSEQNE